jgi:dephospho-CoA kinase
MIRQASATITGFDRGALGKRVFSGDEVARKKLNGIVHPAVRWLMIKAVVWEWVVRGSSVVVLDIPLLFESRLDRFCGLSVVVSTPMEVQLHRLLQRDERLNEEDARGRIVSQWSIGDKRRLADVIIENDSCREVLEERVAKFARLWLWTWLLRIPPVGLTFATFAFLRQWYSPKARAKIV